MKPEVLVLGPEQAIPLAIPALTAVGGSESTGVALPYLRHRDDYVVLSPGVDHVQVHPLKGTHRGPIKLTPLQTFEVEDLRLIVIERASSTATPSKNNDFLNHLQQLTSAFSQPGEFSKSLEKALEILLAQLEVEKGLLITRNLGKEFEIVAQKGVSPNDLWLSETIVQDVLSNKRPTVVQNVFGSPYQSNRSLMATGFISVFVWPLLFRGECLGVIVAGSHRPHSGLSEEDRLRAEVLVQVAALTLNFHLRDSRLKQELANLKKRQENADAPLLTQSPMLTETCQMARQVAGTDLAVLIQGETGVGKELMAKWLHEQSDRRQKPFIAVNCGSIPNELLESLLFGHKKGAFTGAHADHVGKFQQANGGTLFLDEIADLPELLQVKLLRALQEKVVEPLGSQRAIPVDVRLVSATHKNLPSMIAHRLFRDDLYYRLAEIILPIPALRERREDIPLLAAVFKNKYAPSKNFSASAAIWLVEQDWKGNVRELMSAIHRAAVLSTEAEIQTHDFTRGMAGTVPVAGGWLGGANLEEAKASFVRDKVREALRRADGKRTRAAELLGVTPRTLFRYLEELRWNMTEATSPTDNSVADQSAPSPTGPSRH